MKNVQKYLLIIVALFILVGCALNEDVSVDSNPSDNPSEIPYIGILQLTSHPALDAITAGIIDQLQIAGYVNGETATIDFKNAQGDQSNMQSIAEQFFTNDADIMIGIATPAAQALVNVSDEIPIIMGAITDPVAANLIESIEKPGKNITGVSDRLPIQQQFDLMMEILPNLKTVGFMYSSSEDNSASSAKEAEKIAKELSLTVITKTVNTANDVPQAAESLAKDVDAIWVPTDNTIATSIAALVDVTDGYSIPVFPSVDTMVEEGGLAGVGLNQYSIGIQTGKVAVDILEGMDSSTYSVQYPDEIEIIINEEKAEQLNIKIPDNIMEKAIIK